MPVLYEDEGAKAAKILIVSSSQICLNALDELAGRFWHKAELSSSSRVNSNGGYLMHFPDSNAMYSGLEEIKSTVQNTDSHTKIIVYNYPPQAQGP
ncbi:hypothetical protein GW884_02200 [Candidatus Falkowbacteria bacterium]|nr:hypothetical protein [Candidatus Falkowbacteria bacterium]